MKGMTVIVKSITRAVVGYILLYGIYIVTHGHLTPGGGFAGGVVIAGCFILVFLAYGAGIAKIRMEKMWVSLEECLGVFLFWSLAVVGVVKGSAFFENVLAKGEPLKLFSGGSIPISNIGIGIEVAAAIFMIFITLAVLGKGENS